MAELPTTAAAEKKLSSILRDCDDEKNVTRVAESYMDYFDTDAESTKDKRKSNAKQMTLDYYDLATDFYEYGWGESFHFATINSSDRTKEQSSLRHEYRLAMRLGLQKTDNVLDMGCGIGGPARHLAAFSECHITGLNINRYQIGRARELTKRAKLDHLLSFVEGDFTKAPFEDNSFDNIYAIEATCHCGNLLSVYLEAFRLLKPGGMFGVYEWCMTDAYDPNNARHTKIKHEILEGDSLPDLLSTTDALATFKKAGFEVLEAEDLAKKSEVAWYSVLQPRWTLSEIRMTPLGRWATHKMLIGMEATGLAPKGVVKVHNILLKGADGLVRGGQEGVFTPMFFMLGKKPAIQ